MSGVMAISMLLCCIPLHVLRIIGEYTTNDAVGGVSELYHLGIFVFVQKQVNCRLKQDLNSKNIHKWMKVAFNSPICYVCVPNTVNSVICNEILVVFWFSAIY